jgi:hypothetical protein
LSPSIMEEQPLSKARVVSAIAERFRAKEIFTAKAFLTIKSNQTSSA